MIKTNGLSATTTLAILLCAWPSGASSVRRVHRPWLLVSSKSHRAQRMAPHSTHRAVVVAAPSLPTEYSPPSQPSATLTAPATSGERIAEQATRYQGTRYRFGGSNKHGIDCSGLVMRVFEDLKMKRLPHASSALFDTGEPVPTSDLRPGDLVFFKNTYRRGISHVGVYAGHNKFVHAADHRHGVIMTALSDPYYQLHYAGARRLY